MPDQNEDNSNSNIDLTNELISQPIESACPICGILVPVSELHAHSNAHFDDNKPEPQLPPHVYVPIACPICGTMLALDDIDSHALAHAIENEDFDPHTVSDDLYYEELRATYGFTARKRATGRCYICGQPGHWVPECPKNPDNIVSQARIIPEPTATAVAAAQIPDPQFNKPPFDSAAMLRLLGQQTTDQSVPKHFSRCTTLLSNTVVHFGGQKVDSGWGCGYRNIQMLSAHLLATNELVSQALYSGSHFVPDIPSLQAWIEVAWRAGFDAVGAEQLDSSLQGGRKWIGTTEAAVLFRYFGIPAIIIDFGTMKDSIALQQQQQQMKITAFTSPTTAAAKEDDEKGKAANYKTEEVHQGVECDVCGCFPIIGERFKSQVLPNYDVCSQCMKNNSEIDAAAGPFSRISASLPNVNYHQVSKRTKGMVGSYDDAVARHGDSGGSWGAGRLSDNDNKKIECSPAGKSLLNWVWDYFSEADFDALIGAEEKEKNDHVASTSAAPAPASAAPPSSLQHLSRGGPGWKVETHYTCRCPLYLQHEGHSRTIIGVEKRERRDGTSELTLLILDPGVPPPALQDALATGTKWQRLIKRSAHTFNKSQYQIMYCPDNAVPCTPGSTQYDALKVLRAQENY